MGFAAGLRAGSDFAQGILDAYYGAKERKDIEELNQQAPSKYEGTSPESLKYVQMDLGDAEGFNRAPVAEAVRNVPVPEQRVQYLGRDYRADQFTPEVQRTARTQALADIVSRYRPEQGARLGLEAQRGLYESERAAREAEQADYLKSRRFVGERAADVSLQGAEQGLTEGAQRIKRGGLELETAGLTLEQAKRVQADNKSMDDFYQNLKVAQADANAEGRPFSNKDAAALLRSSGLSPELQVKVLGNVTKFGEQVLNARLVDLKNAVQENATLPKLVDWFNKSETLLPGQTFKTETDKKTGAVTLSLVDKDGTVVEAPQSYKNERDAYGYLAARAQDPITAVTYAQGIEDRDLSQKKTRAAISASEAESNLRNAQAAALPEEAKLRRAQVDYYREMKAQAGKQRPIYRDFTATDGTPMLLDITALPVIDGKVQLPPNVVAGKSELTPRETIAYKEFLKLSNDNPEMTDRESDALIRRFGLEKVIPLSSTASNMPGAFGDKGGAKAEGNSAPATGLNRPGAPVYSNQNASITDRISAAYAKDSATGTRYEVSRLRDEAQTTVPKIQSQIATLEKAMMQAPDASQTESMRLKLVKLNNELNAWGGLMPQQGLR